MDIFVAQMADYVKENNLDPISLPDIEKGFSHVSVAIFTCSF